MRALRIGALVAFHTVLSTLLSTGLKLSAASSDWRRFWLWQIAGNMAGFAGVLALTGLLRLVPLHVAHPVTQGLAVIGVQVFAARILFRETIDPLQWVGTGLVIAGIVLISARQ